jgi:hypothetical protein
MYADVAQLVEHFTRNEGVRGSNPRVGLVALRDSDAYRPTCASETQSIAQSPRRSQSGGSVMRSRSVLSTTASVFSIGSRRSLCS